MSKNLRIIYNNVADIADLSASSSLGDYVVGNVKKDKKSYVWRSTTNVASVSGTWDSVQQISSLVLPYTNLEVNSTVRLRLFSDTAKTVTLLDVTSTASNIFLHGNTSSNAYEYGGGSALVMYFNTVESCLSFTIDFIGTEDTYIEVSRIILGKYWSPNFNTEFGISVEFVETSKDIRTESGDLISYPGPAYKVIRFSLNYMDSSDRDQLFTLIRSTGKYIPIYLSLFPEDLDKNKEELHQVYGKFVDSITITHPMYTIYSSSLSVQEV
jgi:hypothetical protein